MKKIKIPLNQWERFYKHDDGLLIQGMKKGKKIVFGFNDFNDEFVSLFYISEAKTGEGVMNWQDYKERTNKM